MNPDLIGKTVTINGVIWNILGVNGNNYRLAWEEKNGERTTTHRTWLDFEQVHKMMKRDETTGDPLPEPPV